MCFSGTVYRGFEFSDLNLVEELKETFDVTYAVKSNEMFKSYTLIKKRKKISIFKKFLNQNTFSNECGFPGFDEKYKNHKRFLSMNTIWIKNWRSLKELIKKNQIIILGSYRDNQWIVEYSRLLNKIVLIHKNPSNLDNESKLLPDIFCLKDQREKENIMSQIRSNKIKYLSGNEVIKVTGSLQHEIRLSSSIDKNKFYKKYELDLTKKLFIFLPCAPQLHNDNYRRDYVEICKIISKKNNVLIKGHPTDYSKRKLKAEYMNLSSWEYLLPNVKACDPEDFYSALKFANAAVSIFSTVFFDVNKMRKPIIFVNRHENFAYNILKKKINVPDQVYDEKIKNNSYQFNKDLLVHIKKYYEGDIYKNEFLLSSPELTSKSYSFFGCDIKINNLENFLEKLDEKSFKYPTLDENKSASHNIKATLVESIEKDVFKKNFSTIIKVFILIYFYKIFKIFKILKWK